MTTAIERLIRECPEGEWLPPTLALVGGVLHHVSVRNDDGSVFHSWPVSDDDPLDTDHILAVQGRLAELLAGKGVAVLPDTADCGTRMWRAWKYDFGDYARPTYFDAQADAWVAVGRG